MSHAVQQPAHVHPPLSVSVVMCTYNGARFLQPQLDSLLAQTRLPDEIVIHDDRSDDATADILRDFEEKTRRSGITTRFRINATNLGYRKNFQTALQAATADLLFLCDQDDIWHPRKIEQFCEAFQRRPALSLLHCNARLVDERGQSLSMSLFDALEITPDTLASMHAGHAFDVLLRRNIVTGAAMAMRRQALSAALPFPENDWIHDEWLAMITSLHSVVDTDASALIDYRQHGTNQVGVRKRGFKEKITGHAVSRRQWMDRLARKLDILLEHLREHPQLASATTLAEIKRRMDHVLARNSLGSHFFARLPVIRAEWAKGNYQRYDLGLLSVISDLLSLH